MLFLLLFKISSYWCFECQHGNFHINQKSISFVWHFHLETISECFILWIFLAFRVSQRETVSKRSCFLKAQITMFKGPVEWRTEELIIIKWSPCFSRLQLLSVLLDLDWCPTDGCIFVPVTLPTHSQDNGWFPSLHPSLVSLWSPLKTMSQSRSNLPWLGLQWAFISFNICLRVQDLIQSIKWLEKPPHWIVTLFWCCW